MKLWLKIGKLCHKRADKRLSDIQKGLIFAASAVLKIADELILAENEIRPPNRNKVMGHTVDSITLLGRAHKQISAERKEDTKTLEPYVTRKLQIQNIFLERICWKA